MLQAVETKVGESKISPILYRILQVKTNLQTGVYPTEQVRCFCGADFNDIVITEFDRYTIPHRMVLCKECGIIRANPRMTKEAYHDFYDKHYHSIYNVTEGNKEVKVEEVFFQGLGKGWNFYKFIEYFDIKPDIVFDIGCNMGSYLLPFKENGSDVYGVDYCSGSVNYGRTQGLDITYGGVEELVKINKKADLIILNHVLEHFLDIEKELFAIKDLLKDTGVLFVGLPGLHLYDIPHLWQNAHTYQFTAETLSYVMGCCGFREYHIDESITSLWVKIPEKRNKSLKPNFEVKNIVDFLLGKQRIPRIRTINKFTVKERKENINKILSYRLPEISPFVQSFKDRDAIIIGGGPSIDNYPDKIKDLKSKGGVIISIERMYSWCLNHDIIPDFVLILDACDDVPKGLQNLHPDTIHLVALQANSKVVDILNGYKTYVFATVQEGIDQHQYWFDHGYEHMVTLNGGGSVTLCAMAVAYTFGLKNLHIFGFDCHVTNGDYAKGIAGVGVPRECYDINIEGKIFKTNNPFLSFLQQFFYLYTIAKYKGLVDKVKIYGDSMVKYASKIPLDGDADG